MSGDGNERLGGRARVTALGQGQSREPGEAGLYLCVPAPPPGPEGPPVPKPTGRGSCRCPIFCLLPLGICFILWKGEEELRGAVPRRPPLCLLALLCPCLGHHKDLGPNPKGTQPLL